MAPKTPLQHQINQRLQAVQSAAQPTLPSRAPNPDKWELSLFDDQSYTVQGALDAREALRRLLANAPNWVRVAVAMRLLVTTWLRWHPKIPKEAFGQFELRPGGRIQDFEISTICGPTRVVAFVQDRHIYVQFELTARYIGDQTQVRLETLTASKTRTGATHLNLVKGLHQRVVKALLPGLSIVDKNFPATLPDYQRPGFRQQSRKKLKAQGLLPEQIMEKVEELKKESAVPLVEIPKKPGPLGKLFGKR